MGLAYKCVGAIDIIEFAGTNLKNSSLWGRFMNNIPSGPIKKDMMKRKLSQRMSDFENKYYAELRKGGNSI